MTSEQWVQELRRRTHRGWYRIRAGLYIGWQTGGANQYLDCYAMKYGQNLQEYVIGRLLSGELPVPDFTGVTYAYGGQWSTPNRYSQVCQMAEAQAIQFDGAPTFDQPSTGRNDGSLPPEYPPPPTRGLPPVVQTPCDCRAASSPGVSGLVPGVVQPSTLGGGNRIILPPPIRRR